MKKNLLKTVIGLGSSILLFMGYLVLSSFTSRDNNVQAQETVYICTGENSTKYHKSKDCSGLRNCKGSIKQISLEQAKKMGRTPCKKCYN